jgi:hypothetical protein
MKPAQRLGSERPFGKVTRRVLAARVCTLGAVLTCRTNQSKDARHYVRTGLNAEPVTTTVNSFEQIGGNWFEKSVTTETAQGGSGAGSRTRTSLRLLGGALVDWSIEYTSDGLVTTRVTSRDPATKTVTSAVTTNRADQTQTATRTYVNGLLVSETVPGASGSIEHDYDALERPTVVKDIAGIRRRTLYDDVPDSDVTKPALARSLVKEEQVKAADAAD